MNVNPFKDSFTGLSVGVPVTLIPPKNRIAKKKVDWLFALSTFVLTVHNGLFCYFNHRLYKKYQCQCNKYV